MTKRRKKKFNRKRLKAAESALIRALSRWHTADHGGKVSR